MSHNELLDVLRKIKPSFNTRKELVSYLQEQLGIDINYNTLKTRWQNYKAYKDAIDRLVSEQVSPTKAKTPIVVGATVADHSEKAQDIYNEILAAFTKTDELQQKKAAQTITFNQDVICLVNTADIHFGDNTDIKSVFDDLEIIENTDGMYVNWLGDMTDNFIGGWTLPINLQTKISPSQQLTVAKWYIKRLANKLKIFTAGNHDLWTEDQSGIDPIFEYLLSLNTNLLYDNYENNVKLIVGDVELMLKVRHQWKSSSIYNPTHGIERAHFQPGNGFDIGVGGHYHNSGLYREFTGNKGTTCAAINCGTYKIYDDYARKLGFAVTNKTTSIALVIDGRKNIRQRYTCFHDLETASKFLKFLQEDK